MVSSIIQILVKRSNGMLKSCLIKQLSKDAVLQCRRKKKIRTCFVSANPIMLKPICLYFLTFCFRDNFRDAEWLERRMHIKCLDQPTIKYGVTVLLRYRVYSQWIKSTVCMYLLIAKTWHGNFLLFLIQIFFSVSSIKALYEMLLISFFFASEDVFFWQHFFW